jgi:hypothetical protein
VDRLQYPRASVSTRRRKSGRLDPSQAAGVEARPLADVVMLDDIRALRRIALYQEKIGRVADANRRAIGRLHSTGALFTAEGTRAGRDLLLAHQHLLKVMALLSELAARVGAPRRGGAVYRELDHLLVRTSKLTRRTGSYLARLPSE